MRYTPAQMKEALELSEETFRYWRRVLPPFQGRRAYGAAFTPGELLALKVVSEMHAVGIQSKKLVPHAARLVALCSQSAWFGLEDQVVVFDGRDVELAPSAVQGPAPHARLLIPLGPLIRQLRQSKEEVQPTQPDIAFPPLGVKQGKSA